jgi:hypothetical protein
MALGMVRQRGAHRGDDTAVRWRSGLTQRRFLDDGVLWLSAVTLRCSYEGQMGSEEGAMAEDDDGRRWQLTVRGLKRRRRL